MNTDLGEHVLFRGQNIDRPLLPRIARDEYSAKMIRSERAMFDEFKRQGHSLAHDTCRTNWDWLALAQHHGLPTRLLDWTQNAMAALWFAIHDATFEKSSPVVWILHSDSTDIINPDKAESPFDGDRTMIFRPTHMTPRIIAQSGYFTVHKHLKKDERMIPLENNRRFKHRLHKIEISRGTGLLVGELQKFGVNSATLFPDLDGLSQRITSEYRFNCMLKATPRRVAGN